MKLIYRGKAKDILQGPKENQVYLKYRDDITAKNGQKHQKIVGKGYLNASISEHIFTYLAQHGILTHFIKAINKNTHLVQKIKMIPLEIIVRNVAAGSFSKKYGVKQGSILAQPTFEFSYKNDQLNDPLLNSDHALALKLISDQEEKTMRKIALKINQLLIKFFNDLNITLVDFKLEFGRTATNKICLGDEFSPDNARLWDKKTKISLDKDQFRYGIGDVKMAYQTILDRIEHGYERPLKEECGVVGIFGAQKSLWLTFNALHSLQHRGQDSAGIAWMKANKIIVKKDNGLLDHVFHNTNFSTILSSHAIGHVRYATTGDLSLANCHPFLFNHSKRSFAIAHNGNISNSPELRKQLEESGAIFYGESDTEVIGHLLMRENGDFLDVLEKVLKKLEGAFSFVFIDHDAIYAARDKVGFRPLALGKTNNGYIVASESVAFDVIGAKFVRDIKPGEIVKISKSGLETRTFFQTNQAQLDAMELVYFARPDSVIDGVNVHEFRKRTGQILAQEAPVQAHMVVPVPDSSISAAQGFSEISNIPLEIGIIKNRYIARTFIQATQNHREIGVQRKLNASSIVKNKEVVLIDDSIVRGTTIKKIIAMVRKKGASKVHIRIASPKIIAPSYYGINIATYHELIAHHYPNNEDIASAIGADSLAYISIAGFKRASPDINLEMCIFEDKYQTFVSPQLIKRAKNEK